MASIPPLATTVVTNAGHAEITLTMTPQAQRSSVDVTATAGAIEQTSSQSTEVRLNEVKILPTKPATVSEILPLVPGIVRSAEGELNIDGSGEHRSALVVNQTDVTDPATGKFGQTIPVDSIESVNVLNTPFLAQYGRFTSGVVAVETRRGGEKWHAELNDPFPDFRIRSWHMRGIRDVSPRGVLGGPLLAQPAVPQYRAAIQFPARIHFDAALPAQRIEKGVVQFLYAARSGDFAETNRHGHVSHQSAAHQLCEPGLF